MEPSGIFTERNVERLNLGRAISVFLRSSAVELPSFVFLLTFSENAFHPRWRAQLMKASVNSSLASLRLHAFALNFPRIGLCSMPQMPCYPLNQWSILTFTNNNHGRDGLIVIRGD